MAQGKQKQDVAEPSTEIATFPELDTSPVSAPAVSTPGEIFMNDKLMDRLDKMADRMASAKNTLPKHFQGNPGDCWTVIMQALQWGMNPFAVAQKTHLVHGTLGYEAQLVNAVITSMAPTTGRLNFEWFGDWDKILGKFKTQTGNNGSYQVPDWKPADEDGLGVRVWATMKGEDEPRVLTLLLKQATVRNSTLWAADPRQQLAYLGTKRWARLYCPDVILGVYTPDEIETAPAPEREVNRNRGAEPATSGTSRTGSLKDKLRPGSSEDSDADVIEGEATPVDDSPSQCELVPSYAQIAEKLNHAKTPDDLQAAVDDMTSYLGSVEDKKERDKQADELRGLYKSTLAKLKGAEDNSEPAI